MQKEATLYRAASELSVVFINVSYELCAVAADVSCFTTETIPFTMPVARSTAGITCATTIIAQNPKNTQTKIPLVSSAIPRAVPAAITVAGSNVPTMVVISALMTSSLYLLIFYRLIAVVLYKA